MDLLKNLEENKVTLEEINAVKSVLSDYIKTTEEIKKRSKTLNKLHSIALELENSKNTEPENLKSDLVKAKEKFDKDLKKEEILSNYLSSFISKMQF